jgi:hypothetical protein
MHSFPASISRHQQRACAAPHTMCRAKHSREPAKCRVFFAVRLASSLQTSSMTVAKEGEEIMQLAMTFIAVVAGLVFSLAVAIVTEELIFGQLIRMFFVAPRASRNVAATRAPKQ